MRTELKVVIVLLLVTQFLVKAIHGLVTTMNIFGAILFLLPVVLAVSWFRRVEHSIEKRKLAKYILIAFPIPVLAVVLLYALMAYGFVTPRVPQPMGYVYIHFAVWTMILIYAISTYKQKTSVTA